jgi:hypothetical protein
MNRVRILVASLLSAVLSLALAAPAIAGEGGEGLYGKTDDKVITNFGFGLIIFFVVVVTVLSLAQSWLGRRKGSR